MNTRFFCVACVFLAGCADVVGGTDPVPAPGRVTGTVARQKTGVGVAGAVLALLDHADTVRTATVSDRTGRFAFEHVPQGEYRVRLVGPELAGLDPLYDALEPEEVAVSVSSDPVDVVFAVVGLLPGRITGTVRCDGVPTPEVDVRVIGGEVDTTARTDAAGLFTALDLRSGFYAVIPLAAPCDLEPAFQVVDLRPGEFEDLDFGR